MTERLYYKDAYLREFSAHVTGAAGDALTVYLDRTAFYPASGGQPFDLGRIANHLALTGACPRSEDGHHTRAVIGKLFPACS